jgi:hypothetical protein
VARIIHVPQRGERANARVREPEVVDNDEVEPITRPVPRKRAAPRWPRQSLAPAVPAPAPRRTVLSAPPARAEGPSPIRPTPRFGAKPDQS